MITSFIANDATAVTSSKLLTNKQVPTVNAVAKKNPLIGVEYVADAAGKETWPAVVPRPVCDHIVLAPTAPQDAAAMGCRAYPVYPASVMPVGVANTMLAAGTDDAVCDVNKPKYVIAIFVPFFGYIARK